MALRREPEDLPPLREYGRPLGQLRMYVNDIDAVLEFLRKRCSAVTLQAGPGVFAETGSDLADATRTELRTVTITTSDPEVSIRLGTGATVSTVEAVDPEARQLVDDVHSILRHYRSPTMYMLGSPYGLGVTLIVVTLLSAGGFVIAAFLSLAVAIAIMAPVSALAGVTTGYLHGSRSGVRLVPRTRRDARAGQRAVGVNVLVGVIVALVTAPVAILITWVSQR